MTPLPLFTFSRQSAVCRQPPAGSHREADVAQVIFLTSIIDLLLVACLLIIKSKVHSVLLKDLNSASLFSFCLTCEPLMCTCMVLIVSCPSVVIKISLIIFKEAYVFIVTILF